MSLLTICQAVADEAGIEPRPTSVIGSSQPVVLRLLRYANKTGTQLMKKVAWQVLRKERTFTSVATETQTSILPSDFDRFVPETFWNRSSQELITGPVTGKEWQSLKASSYSSTPKFAYRGSAVLVIPTPSAGDSFAFEYVSKNWCQSSVGTGQSAWAADIDTGVLDEELMTRGLKYVYLTDEGLPNAQAANDFDDYFNTLLSNDQPDSGIMLAADIFGTASGRHFSGTPEIASNNLLITG